MIITCPNCNKQFQTDKSLIPDEGRDLQCGSCDYVWFFKLDESINETLKLSEEIINKDIRITSEIKKEKIEEKKQPIEKVKTEIFNEKNVKISEKQVNKAKTKTIENKGSKFFSYLIVFILSFMALIILLDTFKTPLMNVFPGLEIILFNLIETLQDIKLFIIDLI